MEFLKRGVFGLLGYLASNYPLSAHFSTQEPPGASWVSERIGAPFRRRGI